MRSSYFPACEAFSKESVDPSATTPSWFLFLQLLSGGRKSDHTVLTPDRQFVGDRRASRDGAGQPIEFGTHEPVAFTASGQGFT
jgi:hypothetical protein